MTLVELARHRRTCKAFDPQRRIRDEDIAQLKTLLRFAPSSVNAQPWHFILAASPEARSTLAATLAGPYVYNQIKVQQASHVFVLCARRDLTPAYLERLLDQEAADGRFATPEARAGQRQTRQHYVDLHCRQQDLATWIDRQVYLAMGTLLLGAASLGIDACAMEGIDAPAIDAALGLEARGLRCVALVALGYRGEGDFNATLPKSRLPEADLVSEI